LLEHARYARLRAQEFDERLFADGAGLAQGANCPPAIFGIGQRLILAQQRDRMQGDQSSAAHVAHARSINS
jgi:hypothetical protein